jgi:hypothetical protein
MMKLRTRIYVCLAVLFVLAFGASLPVPAQQANHAVPSQELRKDVQKASDTRHADEAAIRELLSTEQGQRALKSAKVDLQQVNTAVGQLSDEETARLATQSRAIQKDLAGGHLSDRDLLIIIVAIAALVLIIVAVR